MHRHLDGLQAPLPTPLPEQTCSADEDEDATTDRRSSRSRTSVVAVVGDRGAGSSLRASTLGRLLDVNSVLQPEAEVARAVCSALVDSVCYTVAASELLPAVVHELEFWQQCVWDSATNAGMARSQQRGQASRTVHSSSNTLARLVGAEAPAAGGGSSEAVLAGSPLQQQQQCQQPPPKPQPPLQPQQDHEGPQAPEGQHLAFWETSSEAAAPASTLTQSTAARDAATPGQWPWPPSPPGPTPAALRVRAALQPSPSASHVAPALAGIPVATAPRQARVLSAPAHPLQHAPTPAGVSAFVGSPKELSGLPGPAWLSDAAASCCCSPMPHLLPAPASTGGTRKANHLPPAAALSHHLSHPPNLSHMKSGALLPRLATLHRARCASLTLVSHTAGGGAGPPAGSLPPGGGNAIRPGAGAGVADDGGERGGGVLGCPGTAQQLAGCGGAGHTGHEQPPQQGHDRSSAPMVMTHGDTGPLTSSPYRAAAAAAAAGAGRGPIPAGPATRFASSPHRGGLQRASSSGSGAGLASGAAPHASNPSCSSCYCSWPVGSGGGEAGACEQAWATLFAPCGPFVAPLPSHAVPATTAPQIQQQQKGAAGVSHAVRSLTAAARGASTTSTRGLNGALRGGLRTGATLKNDGLSMAHALETQPAPLLAYERLWVRRWCKVPQLCSLYEWSSSALATAASAGGGSQRGGPGGGGVGSTGGLLVRAASGKLGGTTRGQQGAGQPQASGGLVHSGSYTEAGSLAGGGSAAGARVFCAAVAKRLRELQRLQVETVQQEARPNNVRLTGKTVLATMLAANSAANAASSGILASNDNDSD